MTDTTIAPSAELPPLPEPALVDQFSLEAAYTADQMHSHAASAVAAARMRTDELERICAEVYQVVGILADEAGRFNDPEVTKVLDNLSQQRLVHEAILPFSCLQAQPAVPARCLRYLRDTLQEGTVNEQIVANTALKLLAATPTAPTASTDADEQADALRFRWLCAHPDWHFIEHLCREFAADSSSEFLTGLRRVIDARRSIELSPFDERRAASSPAPAPGHCLRPEMSTTPQPQAPAGVRMADEPITSTGTEGAGPKGGNRK